MRRGFTAAALEDGVRCARPATARTSERAQSARLPRLLRGADAARAAHAHDAVAAVARHAEQRHRPIGIAVLLVVKVRPGDVHAVGLRDGMSLVDLVAERAVDLLLPRQQVAVGVDEDGQPLAAGRGGLARASGSRSTRARAGAHGAAGACDAASGVTRATVSGADTPRPSGASRAAGAPRATERFGVWHLPVTERPRRERGLDAAARHGC